MSRAVWADGEAGKQRSASHERGLSRAKSRGVWLSVSLLILTALGIGCTPTPRILTADEQHIIDRSLVEYPANFELRRYMTNLTAPTAIAFDEDGSLLVAQGERDDEPAIFRVSKAGKLELFYPRDRRFPFNFPVTGWRMYGPIGGMVVYKGEVYVSHRDANGFGVITALDHKGHHRTVVAELPAQGDYGVTDLAIDSTGRLFFGVGTATNSGVVGLDNWGVGWVLEHPQFHDVPWHDLFLFGYRFDSPNPMAGLFGPADIAVTGPFQAFNQATQLRVPGAISGKPSGAICSVSPQGGPIRVEGYGIHNPRGIAFDNYNQPYFTDTGMELRGTRPINKDPDALLRLVLGQTWYGWPDYSRDLVRISEKQFQPPAELISRTGYPEGVRSLIDERDSGLTPPVRDTLLNATFAWMSGAAKLQFAPADWPFRSVAGNAVVALSGDRAPFATDGRQLVGPGGYRVVWVDMERHSIHDLIRNTALLPRSRVNPKMGDLLERPIDPIFAPDGTLYILDFGHMEVRDGKERIERGTGQIFRLIPPREPAKATRPSQPG